MRSLLSLLGGLTAVLILGFWMADSMVPQESAAMATAAAQAPSEDRTSFWLLAVLAWVTAFFVRPSWLSLPLTVIVVFLGGVFVVLGALNGYADAHLRPNQGGSWALLQVGMLMLASRVFTFLRWIRKAPVEELL